MTQVMQPDVGESGLSSHFVPNPIQSDSTVSSSRKHKLAAIGIQSEKYDSDGLRHFNDTRSGFRMAITAEDFATVESMFAEKWDSERRLTELQTINRWMSKVTSLAIALMVAIFIAFAASFLVAVIQLLDIDKNIGALTDIVMAQSVELAELRSEVSGDIAELRSEVSGDIAELRSEVSELQKTAVTKDDLEQLRSEMSSIEPVSSN